MNRDLFKIDIRALEILRAAPTMEAAGVHWTDAVAKSLQTILRDPVLRELVIEQGKKVSPFFLDPFIDDAYDLITKGIVDVIDKIDGEDDL